MSLIAGERVGPYEILALIGKGGMGEVFRARDSRLRRIVAIKILPRDKVADEERKRRFLLEARASSALNHPNIVTIYDIVSEGGIDFIVMEYVAGTPLDEVMQCKRLDMRSALNYAIQIADALGAAHSIGIVHRDVKPANVLITSEGTVKLLDFGLVKLVEPAAGKTQDTTQTAWQTAVETGEGSIAGTAPYMSPEQARGEAVDRRSDIFSFGAVLFELVTGERPFRGKSVIETISAVLTQEPKTIRAIRPGLPIELERIVSRCLRKDIARRFQYIDDVKIELLEIKEQPNTATPVVRSNWRNRVFVMLLVLLAVVEGVWLAIVQNRSPDVALSAVPLTSYPGSERFATFSPDGRQVAFSWNGEKEDNFDIYIKLIGTGAPLRLTSDPAPDFYPAWSPDGRWIAFLRLLPQNRAAVMMISALGGPERKIADTEVYASLAYAPAVNPARIAWSGDGNSLIIVDRDSSRKSFGLFSVSIDTGEKRRLTVPPTAAGWDAGPAVSPNGQSVVFTRTNYNLGVGDLYLLPLSAGTKPGTLRRLTFDNRQNGQAAWTADGRNIIFTSARAGGALALWRIGLAGSRGPQRLAAVGEDSLYPAVAREGNRLIYTKYALDSNIWRVDMRHAPPSPNNTSGIPVVTSTRQDVMPRFSPDGRKIAFSSDRAGNFQVWVCDRDGTNAVQLTTFQGVNFFPSWSPDGQRIAFSSNTSGQFEIYVINAGGGRPEALTHGGEGGAWPTFSRDGKWIYFSSARSGRDEIWKVASHGGGPIQVTKNGGYMPQESADGKSLYYVRQFSTGPLYRIPVQGGEETEVIDAISARSYAVTNEGIYFILPANPKQAREYYEVNTGNALCFLSFSTGTTNIMATLQKPLQLGVTVSPDGSSALYSQVDRLEEDLMLVENFR